MKSRLFYLLIFLLLLANFSFASSPMPPKAVVNDGLKLCKLYGFDPSYNLPSGWRSLPMASQSNYYSEEYEEYIDAVKAECASLGYTYSTGLLRGDYNWGRLVVPLVLELFLVLLVAALAFGIIKMWKNKKSKLDYLVIIAAAVLLVILLILIIINFAFFWPIIDCADGFC